MGTAENKFGIVDCNNQKVLDAKYEEIKPLTENGIYVVKEANSWKLVQKNGEEKLTEELKSVKDIINIKK